MYNEGMYPSYFGNAYYNMPLYGMRYVPRAMGYGMPLRGASGLAGVGRGIGTAGGNSGGILGMLGLGRSAGASGGIAGITKAARGINWGTLITNASRTLGVVNQAIPIVKQTGPMLNNMRTMFKLASVFKDETDSPRMNTKEPVSEIKMNPDTNEVNNVEKGKENEVSTLSNEKKTTTEGSELNINEPSFFI